MDHHSADWSTLWSRKIPGEVSKAKDDGWAFEPSANVTWGKKWPGSGARMMGPWRLGWDQNETAIRLRLLQLTSLFIYFLWFKTSYLSLNLFPLILCVFDTLEPPRSAVSSCTKRRHGQCWNWTELGLSVQWQQRWGCRCLVECLVAKAGGLGYKHLGLFWW